MTSRLEELGMNLQEQVKWLRALKRAYGCTKGWYVEMIRNPIEKPSGYNDEKLTASFFFADTEEHDDEDKRTSYAPQERQLYEGILETLERKIHGRSVLYNATLEEIKLERMNKHS